MVVHNKHNKVAFMFWWKTSAFSIQRKVERKAWFDFTREKYLVSLPSHNNLFLFSNSVCPVTEQCRFRQQSACCRLYNRAVGRSKNR